MAVLVRDQLQRPPMLMTARPKTMIDRNGEGSSDLQPPAKAESRGRKLHAHFTMDPIGSGYQQIRAARPD